MDLPILKYVDILIGFSLVMLLVATVALSISQALLNMARSRSRHLAVGLQQLIRQVHPELLGPHAKEMAQQVLLHPMVGQPRNVVTRSFRAVLKWVLSKFGIKIDALPRKQGAVILREELAICLLEWASGDGAWTMALTPDEDPAKGRDRREALAAALKQRGIEDPASTLRAFRLQAMKNEQEHPEQSAELWRSQALVQTASSDFLASLFQSFDTTMTRTTAQFGVEAQAWVSAVALVLVIAMQLDSFALVRRLSTDDQYRDALVKEAERLTREVEKLDAASGTGKTPSPDTVLNILSGNRCSDIGTDPATGQTANDARTALDRQRCQVNATLQSSTYDLGTKWSPGWWWPPNAFRDLSGKWPGMLVAWLLVSLGAPFWFDMIKNLFKLRSLIAQKDEVDRTQRNAASTTSTATTTTTATTTGEAAGGHLKPAPAPAVNPNHNGAGGPDAADALGEMGDLAATGAHG